MWETLDPFEFGQMGKIIATDKFNVCLYRKAVSLIEMGFSESQISELDLILENPRGLVIVAGDQLSGKTSTISNLLERLENSSSRKIVEIGEWVEYPSTRRAQIDLGPDYQRWIIRSGNDRQDFFEHLLNYDVIARTARPKEIVDFGFEMQAVLAGRLVIVEVQANSIENVIELLTASYPVEQLKNCLLALVLQKYDFPDGFWANQENGDFHKLVFGAEIKRVPEIAWK
jgi:Tfp pilus assembly ATPase PilU